MGPILHLSPSLDGGGAERQLFMLAVEQRSRGYDVHVAVRRAGGVYETPVCQGGVNLHLLGDHKSISPMLIARVSALIGRVRPQIVQTWLPQMDVVGGFAATLHSVPWILTERSSRLAFMRFGALELLRGWIARGSGAVVANSAGGVDYWRRRLSERAAVFRIGNAIDFAGIERAISSGMNKRPAAARRILIVGRLSAEKAVDLIIVALAKVVRELDVHATIIGDGPLRDRIGALITDQGLGEHCSMLSFQRDWWRLLPTASMLVCMSRFEGHPNVVLEAAAARCPLVVSDIPAHREFLDEQCAILVQPNCQVPLVEAIRGVLLDEDSARARAERAAARVRSLTVAAAADAYEAVYRSVIGEK